VAQGLGGSNSFGMLLHEKHTRTSLNEVLAKLTKRKKSKNLTILLRMARKSKRLCKDYVKLWSRLR
jgi:predicted CopG family antitoxin